MIAERERACDDIVLRHGAKPADYAEQILQVAAGLPAGRFAFGGIAMARRSRLEKRLRAIPDGPRNRSAVTRLAAIAAAVLLAAIVVPVAMMRAAAGTDSILEGGWGGATNGVRTRLTADGTVFRAGHSVPLKFEVTNVSDHVVTFETPSMPWNQTLIVLDAQKKPVPYIGGSAQVAVKRSDLAPAQATVVRTFDLKGSRCVCVRRLPKTRNVRRACSPTLPIKASMNLFR